MTKNEIMKDMAFIQQCRIFGLDCRNFEVFDDVILVNTPQKDLYVLLDKNYNTIGIERIISDCSREDKISIVKRKYSEYCSTTISVYPFENFTLKQIMDIARKIEIIETNHGHSFDTLIDGQLLDTKTNKDKDCSQLLSYIKFLGEKLISTLLLTIILKL